jgi:prolipoprotein diacylglyceryl transferase
MAADFSQFWIWNVDPVMLRIAGLQIRWYSVCFFLVFALGYVVWHRQMVRAGHGVVPTSRIIVWSAAAVIVGGRLAQVVFYEPEHFLAHPREIFAVQSGGLASHGSATALILMLWLYARYYGYSIAEIADRFAMPAMLGAALVRIGNFFNSEIVGREWTGPWAVRFPSYAADNQAVWERAHGALGWTAQALPRHPVQLYEAAGLLAIFAVLWQVEQRMGNRRPRGLLAGLLLALYFSFRFAIEYTKEHLRDTRLVPDAAQQVIRVVSDVAWSPGQWLSVPFALAGLVVIAVALRAKLPPTQLSRWDR